jgi:uncharacterized protein YfiM (DUF2279 family)
VNFNTLPRFVIVLSLSGLLSAAAQLSAIPPAGPAPDVSVGGSSPFADPAADFYHAELLRLQGAGIGREGRLGELLAPLFAAAAARSREHDPVTENRALLGILAGWATGRSGPPGPDGRPFDFRMTLAGRRDLAQHFLISAAIAASGETALSRLVGLMKEIADSNGGSGFSFADIAADRAGVCFGEAATRTHDSARELQRRMADGIEDAELLPPVDDMPEQLDRAALSEHFGGPGGTAYRALIAEIDRRIASLTLYSR